MNFNILRRYWIMLNTFIKSNGYSKAEYLKKIGHFKKMGTHCFLQPFN